MAHSPRQEVGRQAEEHAADYLRTHGLEPVLANHRCRFGELDLVMRDGSTLVVIEVRKRSSRDFGGAAASVTLLKQRRIVRATRHLLMVRPDLRRFPIRFDVVALEPGVERTNIVWLRGAFGA